MQIHLLWHFFLIAFINHYYFTDENSKVLFSGFASRNVFCKSDEGFMVAAGCKKEKYYVEAAPLGLAINFSTMAGGPWNLLLCYVTHHRLQCRTGFDGCGNINTVCNFNVREMCCASAKGLLIYGGSFPFVYCRRDIVRGDVSKRGENLPPVKRKLS